MHREELFNGAFLAASIVDGACDRHGLLDDLASGFASKGVGTIGGLELCADAQSIGTRVRVAKNDLNRIDLVLTVEIGRLVVAVRLMAAAREIWIVQRVESDDVFGSAISSNTGRTEEGSGVMELNRHLAPEGIRRVDLSEWS